MATLQERKHYRDAIMKALYETTEGNRFLGVTGQSCATIFKSLSRTWQQPAHIWWAKGSSPSTGHKETHP